MAGTVASPQRPAAVILTASFDLRFYEYMPGVVAVRDLPEGKLLGLAE